MDKVTLIDELSSIVEHFRPKVVGELNGQHVKLVKFRGEFVWHHHANADELFLGVAGRFRIEFRDRAVELGPGEFIVVPHGVEHRPVADEEVAVLLFEPAGTRNTGNVYDARLTAPSVPGCRKRGQPPPSPTSLSPGPDSGREGVRPPFRQSAGAIRSG